MATDVKIDNYEGETEDILKKIQESGTEPRENVFRRISKGILDPDVVEELIKRGFCSAPASIKYHGNYEGGLFDHSYAVAKSLQSLTKAINLEWQRPESPFIVGMLHDLCKIDSYATDPKHGFLIYNNEGSVIKGHGMKSVVYAQQYMKLTEEEVACIAYHMGAFTPKEEWNDYTNAIHYFPNVLWTHTADMVASQIMNT